MERDENENTLGPLPKAFEPRPNEDGLSVSWCEYFAGLPDEQLRCGIEALRGSLKVRPQACFCVADTAELISAIVDAGFCGRALYHPVNDNAAHAGIYGISAKEDELLQLLADDTWSNFYTKNDADALPFTECSKSADVT